MTAQKFEGAHKRLAMGDSYNDQFNEAWEKLGGDLLPYAEERGRPRPQSCNRRIRTIA